MSTSRNPLMKLGFHLLAGATLSATLLGCSASSKEEVVPALPYPTRDAFCGGVATAACGDGSSQVMNRCSPASVESCVSKAKAGCLANTLVVSSRQTNVANPFRAASAEACVAVVREVFADAQLDKADFEKLAKACDPVFSTANGEGGECKVDADCDSSLFCQRVGNQAGTCQVGKEVGGGENCQDKGARCPATQFCSSIGSCIAKLGDGKSCNDGTCGDGLRCAADPSVDPNSLGEGQEVPLICQPLLNSGAKCVANTACSTGVCGQVTSGGQTRPECLNAIVLAPSEPYCQNNFR